VIFADKASAQYNGQYGQYQQANPCAPTFGLLGPIIDQMKAAQRAQACQQQRDAVMRQQQEQYAAQQAQLAAQRAAAEAQARAATEAQLAAQRAAEQRQAIIDAQTRAEIAAQKWAEESPDNFCKTPDVARNLIKEYNSMHWPAYTTREVVDIEHLVTVTNDRDKAILSCHGVWVHTNGQNIEGTLTMHPNVAGDIIVSWNQEHWEPPLSAAQQASIRAAASVPTGLGSDLPDQPAAYSQGFADRKAWEDSFASTSGDFRTGALFWAGKRSLPPPTPCTTLDGDAAAGCNAAQARLTTSDARRKREISYKQGWNAYTPP
jgi:hypothetical protein